MKPDYAHFILVTFNSLVFLTNYLDTYLGRFLGPGGHVNDLYSQHVPKGINETTKRRVETRAAKTLPRACLSYSRS